MHAILYWNDELNIARCSLCQATQPGITAVDFVTAAGTDERLTCVDCGHVFGELRTGMLRLCARGPCQAVFVSGPTSTQKFCSYWCAHTKERRKDYAENSDNLSARSGE